MVLQLDREHFLLKIHFIIHDNSSLTSVCLFSAKESLAKGLQGNTTESEDAVPIGTVCIVMMTLTLATVILLDINKLSADCKWGRENMKSRMRNNKVTDSHTHIQDQPCAGQTP